MMAAEVSVAQALLALAALFLFGLVGRVHPRYPRRSQRIAVLVSLYLIGLAYSGLSDQMSARIGGFLMGGAVVWMGVNRATRGEHSPTTSRGPATS